MLIRKITKQQNDYLVSLDVCTCYSKRIGYYVLDCYINEFIVSDLNLTDAFIMNDEESDVNNVIVLLPTDFAPQLAGMINMVYLSCVEETFEYPLNTWRVDNVDVPNTIRLTPVEMREISEGDDVLINGIIETWNYYNTSKLINFNIIFNNRQEFTNWKKTIIL